VNTKWNIFAATTGQVFAREEFSLVGQISAAFYSTVQRLARRVLAYRCCTPAQDVEPATGRAFRVTRLLLRPTGQRRLVSRHLGNCEMTHRQEPLSVPMSIRRWSMRKHPAFQEARHARFQSQSHGLRLAYLGVHLERVNQRGFACAEYRVHGFSGPRRRRTGLFYFSFCPLLPAVPLSRRTQGSCGSTLDPIWHLMLSRD